jgi:transposase-like protein
MARKKPWNVAGDKSKTVAAIPAACSDERLAVEFLELQRWGEHPACPRCGDTDVYQIKGRDGERNTRFLWDCRGCRQQFTVRIGTVFEDSRIPLRHWCYAFWAACASKKGVSALQIKRQTGLSYKSALFLMHRIRFAMSDPIGVDDTPLEGVVEVDETYVGGKPRGRPTLGWGHRRRNKKTPVVAMVQRGNPGRVRAFAVPRVTSRTLKAAIKANVHRDTRLMTDDSNLYTLVGREYWNHEVVRHREYEYARGDVTTNTVESFFALLKRGVYGTFHSVSPEHLHRYVSEFQFRWNTRKMDDGARTIAAIRNGEGKRLMTRYRIPVRH